MKIELLIITLVTVLSSCSFSITETEGYKLDDNYPRIVDVNKDTLGIYPTFKSVGNKMDDFLPNESKILTFVEGDYNYDGLTDQVVLVQNSGYKILLVLLKNNTEEYSYTLVEQCDLTTPYYVKYGLTTSGNAFTVSVTTFNTDLCYCVKNYKFSYNISGFYLTNVETKLFPTNSTSSVTNQYSWIGGNVTTDINENYYLINRLDKYFGINFNKTTERINSNIGQKPHITLRDFDPNKEYYYETTKPKEILTNNSYQNGDILNNGGDVVVYGDYLYYITKNTYAEGAENLGGVYRMKSDGTDKTMLLSFGYDIEKPKIFIKDEDLYLSATNFDYPNNNQISAYKVSLNGFQTISLSKGQLYNFDIENDKLYIAKDNNGLKIIVVMDKNGKNQKQLLSTEGEIIDITNNGIYYTEKVLDEESTTLFFKKMSLDGENITNVFTTKVDSTDENETIIADLLEFPENIVFTAGYYLKTGEFYGKIYSVDTNNNQLNVVSPESDGKLFYDELSGKILYKKTENDGFYTYRHISKDFTVNEQFSVKDDILLFSDNFKIYTQKSEDDIHDSLYVRHIDNKTDPILLFDTCEIDNIFAENSFLEYEKIEIIDDFVYLQIYEKAIDESSNKTKFLSEIYIKVRLDGTNLQLLNYNNLKL